VEGLNEQRIRLGGPPKQCNPDTTLREKKEKILHDITIALYDRYKCFHKKGNPEGFSFAKSPTVKGVQPVVFFDQLEGDLDPPFDPDDFMTLFENKYGSTYAEPINKTLGTHQNWFKWLLSCFFDAPKSKQFMDGYSIFDTKPTNQEDAGPKGYELYSSDDEWDSDDDSENELKL